jgi:hypothetical protein
MIFRRSLLAAPAVLLLPRGLRAQLSQTGAGPKAGGGGVSVLDVHVANPSDLTQANWVPFSSSFIAQFGFPDPNSNPNASRLTASVTFGTYIQAAPTSPTIVTGQQYRLTGSFQPGIGGPYLYFGLSDGTNAAAGAFNLTTGTFNSNQNAGGGSVISNSITAITNGYFTCSVVVSFTVVGAAKVTVGWGSIPSGGASVIGDTLTCYQVCV